MRQIKFRGLKDDISNCNWVYGDLNQNPVHYDCQILQNGVIANSVLPNTVGQFTGLTDKNGKDVYEGDIVKGSELRNGDFTQDNYKVVYEDYAFCVEALSEKGCDAWLSLFGFHDNNVLTEIEVIGNIHENPELLKK